MKLETTWADYFKKWRGRRAGGPPRVRRDEIFWSWLGSMLGIGSLSWLGAIYFEPNNLHLMLGSFGASAVLLYGTPRSPLAQPRNLLGGHIISAGIGVTAWWLFHEFPILAQTMAVSLAILLMHLTRTLHPPGGATALIATLGSAEIQRLGFCLVCPDACNAWSVDTAPGGVDHQQPATDPLLPGNLVLSFFAATETTQWRLRDGFTDGLNECLNRLASRD